MRWLSLCLLVLVACGDGMVDGSYLGDPYLRVEGVFRGSTGEADLHSPRLGIIWPTPDGNHEIARLDTRLTPILADPLSRSFSFEVWDLPPPSARLSFCGVRLALGTLAVYDDVNDDGRIELVSDEGLLQVIAPDKALGLSTSYYLLYVEEQLDDCDAPIGGLPDLAPGYHVIAIHGCETWESQSAFVEVRLFPPEASFPPHLADDRECDLES